MTSSINPEVYKKLKNARKVLTRDDSQVEIEVREDEEQAVKLQEIIDILVAAGYFRARIKGLSAFDKVVGGMVWCIESCNVDLDVDLLFRENLSIGEKISLTEKIVAVLPKIKCPLTVEPHQIQGLDFIHIFPVIQWLVKRSLECRQDVAAFVRKCAIDQFDKKFDIQDEIKQKKRNLLNNIRLLEEVYRPHRYYRKKNVGPSETVSQLQITLLEYGHSDGNLDDYSLFTTKEKENIDEQKISDVDEVRLNKHYISLQTELKDVGVQSRDRLLITSMEDKKQIFMDKYSELMKNQSSLDGDIARTMEQLEGIRNKIQEAAEKLQNLSPEHVDTSKVKEIEDLIILNDDLKSQESQFKEHCKKELANLNKLIQEAKNTKNSDLIENTVDLTKDIDDATERVRVLRIKLAKVNREVAMLQRQIDDVPKRAELAQYQKRFVELYNQVAVKHKETKQYYTLYNTLEDTRVYMKKELSLLNSISESYPEAMMSAKGKAEFLDQFQNIVENVRQTKLKSEQKLNREKQTRDQLSAMLQGLVELQRKYVTAIKQLDLECRKHETLIKTQS
ncbi:coiled-coil domain-containing protein 93 [Diorhabda sublineata]|uniref:coiled-coil domain-containing protein 93 n=1 Tax=Diorhabda sublineata TaxID=1163346 RepID=UPI0024E17BC3|nr:coiled-coil domain-containing protein 93 [Diorhabda sublineata]